MPQVITGMPYMVMFNELGYEFLTSKHVLVILIVSCANLIVAPDNLSMYHQ